LQPVTHQVAALCAPAGEKECSIDKLSINGNGEAQGDQVQILNFVAQIALKFEKIFVISHYVMHP